MSGGRAFGVVLGAGALIWLILKPRSSSAATGDNRSRRDDSATPPEIPVRASDWQGWVWPVPVYQGRTPTISHEFKAGSRYGGDGKLNYGAHLGVDVMFRRKPSDPSGPPDTVAIPQGGTNPGWISPVGTPVVAAGPGKIWSSGTTALGHFVQIDHGNVGSAGGVNTFYQHLSSLAKPWKKGDDVRAGEVLGTMGGDPSNVPHLRHLHFELWFPRAGLSNEQWAHDPEPFMRTWKIA